MTIVAADYQTAIGALQGHLGKGTSPGAFEQRTLIGIIRDSVRRLTNTTDLTEASTDIATQVEDIDAEVVVLTLLDATACAAGAGVAAAADVAAAVTALTTASAALADDILLVEADPNMADVAASLAAQIVAIDAEIALLTPLDAAACADGAGVAAAAIILASVVALTAVSVALVADGVLIDAAYAIPTLIVNTVADGG